MSLLVNFANVLKGDWLGTKPAPVVRTPILASPANVPVRALCIDIDPRPYQLEDIAWARDQKRVILAWEAGMGKTFAGAEAAELPAVVSCPLELVEQWRDYLELQYPTDRVVVAAYGDPIARDKAINSKWDWLIVNHDMWRKFLIPDATTLIVDEVHHFRRPDPQRSKWIRAYAHRTPRFIGLTATLEYKDGGDMYHPLHMIDPKSWPSYWAFLAKYFIVDSTGYGTRIARVRNRARLQDAIRPYVRERTYKGEGVSLPRRIAKHVKLRMSDADMKRYRTLRDYFRLNVLNDDGEEEVKRLFNAGAVLHELRKMTMTKHKLEAVKSIIEDTPGKHPIMVFCYYRDTAERAAEFLDGVCIHGGIGSAADRRTNAITGGPERKRVRVATMASLSEGADISDGRTVIYLEEDYVPGRKYQTERRVLRFRTGDDDGVPVVVHHIRYEGTVDVIVHETSKRRVAGNALTVLKEALETE